MLAIVLALTASLSYGAGDVLAGSQARRTTLWLVLVLSQFSGLAVLAAVVLARGRPLPVDVLLPAVAAGLLSVVFIASYYGALAIGVMGIVSPIASLSVAVPVIVGLASGERPSALQLTGMAIALGGVLLAVYRKSAGKHHQTTSVASIWLAVLTAVAYGFAMVFYARGAESDPYWSVTLARVVSTAVLVLAYVILRPRLGFTRPAAVRVLAVGVFEVGAYTLYSVSSTLGYLSVVSVLSSIYPVFVVIFAYIFLQERLARAQQAGVAATLAGVALIAAG